MKTLLATTKWALVAALPLELVNYFVVGDPADNHHALEGWFAAIAGQWYLLHLPGIFVLNAVQFLRTFRSLGSIVLFLSGWIDTTLLFAVLLLPALMALQIFRRSRRPITGED